MAIEWATGFDPHEDPFVSFFIDAANWVGDTFFGGSHATNEANMAMNQQNIAYQQQENEITRMREDNAVQRAANDMTAAGLSKTLAAGNPASAQALTAPSNSNQMQRNLAGLNAIQFIKDLHFKKKEDKRADALNDATIKKLEAEAAGQLLANTTYMQNFTNEQAVKLANRDFIVAQTNLANANAKFQSIVNDNEQERINSVIQKNIADAELANSGKALNEAQVDKVIEETKNELYRRYGIYYSGLMTKEEYNGVKIDNEKKKAEIDLLVVDLVKAQIESNILTQNLWYGIYNGLPVGAVPNGLIGGMYNTSQAIAAGLNNNGFSMKFPYSLNINTTSSLNNSQLPQPI